MTNRIGMDVEQLLRWAYVDELSKQQLSAAEAVWDGIFDFANHGGIRDFRVINDRTIYLQGNGRRWYRADLMGSCSGLRFRDTLGFESDPDGSFSRFSTIRTRGQSCAVRSLVESGPPPRKAKYRR